MKKSTSTANNKQTLARIDTDFIIHNTNQLSEREKRMFFLIVFQFEGDKELFISLVDIIKSQDNFGFKWKKSISELNSFLRNLSKLSVEFNSGVFVNGVELKGFINIFQSIKPIDKKGMQGYRVLFSEDILPAINDLKQYVGNEYNKLKNNQI